MFFEVAVRFDRIELELHGLIICMECILSKGGYSIQTLARQGDFSYRHPIDHHINTERLRPRDGLSRAQVDEVLGRGPSSTVCDGYAKQLAARDDASLNQFIVTAVAEKISVLNTEAFFQERAQRSNPKRALAALAKVRQVAPQDGDAL